MSNFRVHKGGRIRAGTGPGDLVDYSGDFRLFEVVRTLAMVRKAPSFGSPYIEQRAGAADHVLNCDIATNEGDATGVWPVLWAAQETVTGEVYFDVVVGRGAVSSTNPRFTLYVIVSELSLGSAPGQTRAQSRSFPARAVTGPLSSDA